MNRETSNYLLVVDFNAGWVRSLFTAFPGLADGSRRIIAWRVWGLHYWLTHRHQLKSSHTPAGKVPALEESEVVVPSWNSLASLSTWKLVRQIRRVITENGPPEAIVYTLPYYAGVAEKFREQSQVYYAYDAYRHYSGWDAVRIDALEKRILDACNVAFTVSRQLQEDLQKRTQTPVHYSPNAVSQDFVRRMALPVEGRPADLRGIEGKIVGCVGQISGSGYDWELIERVAALLPEINFVFIGPLADDPPGSRANIESLFRKQNIHWLGAKPHNELADYIANFDVCFGPYRVNEIKNRGSPLRMYDYLCTNKGILFTPIREVREHRDLVEIGATPEECAQVIRNMFAPDYEVDCVKRREFIAENTWERRAEVLRSRIQESKGKGTARNADQRKFPLPAV